MDINPGGTISPRDVVGRDPLIQIYWRDLDVRSLALVAPRRVGKSCILRRMVELPQDGFLLCPADLQAVRTVEAFVFAVFDQVSEHISKLRKTESAMTRLVGLMGGTFEGGSLKVQLGALDALRLLSGVFDDLEAVAAKRGVRIVLCWDEFTWFLHNAADDGQARQAGQLLDRLREVRQSPRHTHLRMVFTGSIGLEEVMLRMRREGYSNDPFNDVSRQVVPLLEPDQAEHLARGLIAGLAGAQVEAIGQQIALCCEGHPFFIHHVARDLRDRQRWSVEAVSQSVDRLLADTQDPLELSQFLDRIDTYQGREQGLLARRLLDAIAARPRSQRELLGLGIERETTLELLRFLRRDLYIDRAGELWSFRIGLLARYWRQERGIDAESGGEA